jgi:hypothetical protein
MGSAEREGAGGGGEAEGVRENGGMKQQEGIRKLVVGVCVMEKKVREQDEEEEEEEGRRRKKRRRDLRERESFSQLCLELVSVTYCMVCLTCVSSVLGFVFLGLLASF